MIEEITNLVREFVSKNNIKEHSIHDDSDIVEEESYGNANQFEDDTFIDLKNIEKKLFNIGISKCASTSTTKYLRDQVKFVPMYEREYDRHNIQQFNEYTGFSIIRNPTSRWISGLNEFMTNEESKNRSRDTSYVEEQLRKNKFIFDSHTHVQVDFLLDFFSEINHVSLKDFNLIRLDKNLSQKISLILGQDIRLEYLNVTQFDDFSNKKINLNFCKKMFETYCEKNPKYYKIYEFDYRLFNISK